MSFSIMFTKLSPFSNFEKFSLDLSAKNASSQYVESLHALFYSKTARNEVAGKTERWAGEEVSDRAVLRKESTGVNFVIKP
jgi:hypothetical protein